MNRVKAATLLLAAVAGCDRAKTIRDGPIQLPSAVWTSVPTRGFRVSGPFGDLCLEVDGTRYDILPLQPGVLTDANGGTVTVEGRIVADSGRTVSFAKPNTLSGGNVKALCFPQSSAMGNDIFRQVEIRATAPLTVRKITWWSGRPSGSL